MPMALTRRADDAVQKLVGRLVCLGSSGCVRLICCVCCYVCVLLLCVFVVFVLAAVADIEVCSQILNMALAIYTYLLRNVVIAIRSKRKAERESGKVGKKETN